LSEPQSVRGNQRRPAKHAEGGVLAQFLALAFALLPLIACNLLPTPTPLPLPTELATTPLPLESQLGGLEATFVSVVTVDGAGEERCFKLYRFYPDGLALYANFTYAATAPSAATWPEVDRWFRRPAGKTQLAAESAPVLPRRLDAASGDMLSRLALRPARPGPLFL
jgi:hypothetical protein